MKIKILFLLFISITSFSYSQVTKKINYKANWSETRPSYPDEIIMVEKVEFEHEGMRMYCDSAIFNEKENRFNAFGNIHIVQKDTLHIWGDELYYEGQTKTAEMFGKRIVMKDNQMTMHTTYLILEREQNTIKYTRWADIFDEKSKLRSQKATYNMSTKDILFNSNVEITSDSTKVYSDTMNYNTKTNISTFYGPTNIITNDSTFIYTELGWYNTKTEESMSVKQSQMINKERLLQADTLFYNSQTKIGEGISNIYIEDTTQKLVVTGNKAYINNKDSLSYTFITNMAMVQQVDSKDTLYLHSDTIWLDHDTSMNIKFIKAYYHAKFFRNDIQGAAEYIKYSFEDSILLMTNNPVFWNEQNQITADTILMNIGKNNIYGFQTYYNSLVVQNSDTLTEYRFNQIGGKRMVGYFENNKLYLVNVFGNAQSIYYIWEENKDTTSSLMGVNIGSGSEMKVYIDDKKIKKITTITSPVFYTDDEEKIIAEEKTLKGFMWMKKDRPKKPLDIFIER